MNDEGSRMRAVVSVTIEDALAVHDIKVIEGRDRFFVAMPSRKLADGTHKDIVHPVSDQMRDQIERAVMKHYFYVRERMENEARHER